MLKTTRINISPEQPNIYIANRTHPALKPYRPAGKGNAMPNLNQPFSAETDFQALNCHFAERPLDELLQWSLKTFGNGLAQITSFGPTGIVILDHLARLSPGVKIITIDTNFLFPETYRLIEEIKARFPVNLQIHRPAISPQTQAERHGPALWTNDPDKCCQLRKVAPLTEAMRPLSAWITGLRRDQSPTRSNLSLIAWDDKYQLVKLNPLANWTRQDVWAYIVKHNLPYNKLHDQGYASIGCTHCTLPSLNEADERSGRWQGQAKTECGIHLKLETE